MFIESPTIYSLSQTKSKINKKEKVYKKKENFTQKKNAT